MSIALNKYVFLVINIFFILFAFLLGVGYTQTYWLVYLAPLVFMIVIFVIMCLNISKQHKKELKDMKISENILSWLVVKNFMDIHLEDRRYFLKNIFSTQLDEDGESYEKRKRK